MFAWKLAEPFQKQITLARAGDDPQFAVDLREFAATPTDRITPKQLRQRERRMLAKAQLPSPSQQAWFWYLIGTAYAHQQQPYHAFETLALSIRAFDRVKPPDLLVHAHLSYAFTVIAQQVERYLLALAACNNIIADVQELQEQQSPLLNAADWQLALDEAHRLHAELCAAMPLETDVAESE